MIVRAIERGVTEAVIADALGLEVQSIRARFRLLDGICTEAADALKALRKRLEAEAQACGFARERAQTAHITLAYLPRGVQPPALPDTGTVATPLRIDRFHLLQTVPGGYMSLQSWPLQSQDA